MRIVATISENAVLEQQSNYCIVPNHVIADIESLETINIFSKLFSELMSM